MTTLTDQVAGALGQPGVLMFGAVEILLPGAAVRLLDGSGLASFNGAQFVGLDPVYGSLSSISSYTDGVDGQAPSVTLTLLTPTNAGVAALAAPAAQGSQVSIWVGVMDPVTGLVVPDPVLCLIGEIDVPTLQIGQNTRSIQLSIISIWDRFLEQDEGFCLNNGFQQSLWPGELGLEFVSAVQQQLPWGSDAPRPVLVTDVPNLYGIRGLISAA